MYVRINEFVEFVEVEGTQKFFLVELYLRFVFTCLDMFFDIF